MGKHITELTAEELNKHNKDWLQVTQALRNHASEMRADGPEGPRLEATDYFGVLFVIGLFIWSITG